jgi:hypothetical protein
MADSTTTNYAFTKPEVGSSTGTWGGKLNTNWDDLDADLATLAVKGNNLSDLTNAATALTNLGLTSTAAELNILDGVTSTAAELNLLDGVTATTAELNYSDGVTSAIQTQLDAKQASDADLTTLATNGIGTSANQLVQLNGSAELPAVSGANLTNLPAGGSMVLLSTVTASAASTVDIETTFDSTYEDYVIMADVNVSGGAYAIQCRLKISGSYNTATNRWSLNRRTASSTTTTATAGGATDGQIKLGDNDPRSLIMTIHGPSSTTLNKMISWTGLVSTTNVLAKEWGHGGVNSNTAALTGVRFLNVGGTVTGTFRLYGIAK